MNGINDRLEFLMNFCDGNIIEIGAGNGGQTTTFLKRAQKTAKKVFVIDPFESAWDKMPYPYGRPYPESVFIENVKDYTDNLVLIKKMSQKVNFDNFQNVSFVFIDGLQFKDAVLIDLNNAVKTGAEIICVDDVNRLTDHSQVPLALAEFNTHYKFYNTNDREGYFYK